MIQSLTDEQFIKKAKKVLDAFGINYKNYEVYVDREHSEETKEIDASILDTYSVVFTYRERGTRGSLMAVVIDKHTEKLTHVITRSNMFDVPEELQ